MDAHQARLAAAESAGTIRRAVPGIEPAASPDGTGLPHALHLALALGGGGPGIPPLAPADGSAASAAVAAAAPGVEPERRPDGRGMAHAAFMVREIGAGMSANKRLRWLGYLESLLAHEGVAPLPMPGGGDPMAEDAVMLALGRIQGAMVAGGATSLEAEKARNLAASGAQA